MKKILLTFFACIVGIIFSASFINSHSLTPPAGMACNASGCHNGSGGFGSCTDSMIIVSKYLGQQFRGTGAPTNSILVLYNNSNPIVVDTLTITLKLPQTPIAGFQFYVSDNNNNNAGHFFIVNSTNTIVTNSGGISYMSHYNATSGSNSWTFKWSPNSSTVFPITFHFGIVCDTAIIRSGGGGGGGCVPNCTGSSSGTFGGGTVDCSYFDPGCYFIFSKTDYCQGDTISGSNNCSGNFGYFLWSDYTFAGAGTNFSTNGSWGNTISTTSGTVAGYAYYSYACATAVIQTSSYGGAYATVHPIPHPVPTIADKAICRGQAVKLGSKKIPSLINLGGWWYPDYHPDTVYNNIAAFSWTPTSSLSNPNDSNPTASPFVTTKYIVQTMAGGCVAHDTQTVFVKQPTTSSLSANICNGSNFVFHNKIFSVTGTFYDTLINHVGCDSIIALNIHVVQATSSSLNAAICNGNNFIFHGKTFTNSGTFYDTLVNHVSCDSIVTLHISVGYASASSINDNFCNGHSYSFHGKNYSSAGIFYDTLINHVGCDSVITLNLTINPISNYSFNHSICSNHPYFFNGHKLNSTGVYFDTLTNYFGCDSFITLHLQVNQISNYSYNHSICNNQTYLFNGHYLNSSGIYFDTLTNYLGCNSFITLHLQVKSISTKTISQTICAGNYFNFNGKNLSQTGTYKDTLQNYLGCDSIVTLHLSVSPPLTSISSATICKNESFNFNGKNLTQAGIYNDTLQNANGCDSIVTMNLSVLQNRNFNLSQSLCLGSAFTFHGKTYSTTGIFADTIFSNTSCDSIFTITINQLGTVDTAVLQQNNLLIAHATNCHYQWFDCAGQTIIAGATFDTLAPTIAGYYAVIVATIPDNCVDTSACHFVYVTGIENLQNKNLQIKLFPNPTDGLLQIEFEKPLKEATIKVLNDKGEIMRTINIKNTKKSTIDLSAFASGIYMFEIIADEAVGYYKVVKE